MAEPFITTGGQLHPDILAAIKDRLVRAGAGVGGYLKHVGEGLVDTVKYPGEVFQAGMRGEAPTTEEMVPWAAGQAMGMVGGATPFSLSGAVGSGGGRLVTPEGLAIKGKEFSKRSAEVQRDLAAEPKGTGPLDLASAEGVPNVAQRDVERYTPPRGISPRMVDALANPDVISGVSESIRKGVSMGAHKWYHTEPIRQAFVKELGEEAGMKSFREYMDLVAATSPRSDVPTNIRNASYYYTKRGQELPETLPYPYGHVAQNLHRQNFGTLSAAGVEGGGWDVLRNPKPASFAENLVGNLEPVTVDTHAFRNLGMRTRDPRFLATSVQVKRSSSADPGLDTMIKKYGEVNGDRVTFRPQQLYREGKLTMDEAQKLPSFWETQPRESEYAAVEQFYRKLAKEHGLAPADAQAAAWAGAGELTGLGSPPTHTFPELFNQRVEYTARMRGEKPEETLSAMIRGKKPLLSIAGGAAAAPPLFGSLAPPEQQ